MTDYTYNSYSVVGKKEDVSDIITNITPTKAPFTTMTKQETVHNSVFQWQEDALRNPAANNNPEGFVATATARTPTTMRNNVTQIFQDTFGVTGTNDAVTKYGRGKEMAYQAAKAAAALKLDLEYAFVGTKQTEVNPTDNTSNRIFAGFQAQVDTGNIIKTGGSTTVMTESNYLDALQQAYVVGADPSITLVTPAASRTIANFIDTAGKSRVFNDDATKLVNCVNLYVSPFGQEKIVLSRYLASTDTLIFDPSMWKRVALTGRNWFRETLAKIGDSTQMMIVGEFSLKHMHQKSSALVTQSA